MHSYSNSKEIVVVPFTWFTTQEVSKPVGLADNSEGRTT